MHLDLAMRQVQDDVSLANMSDLKYLDLTISQVYCTWMWQLAKFKII